MKKKSALLALALMLAFSVNVYAKDQILSDETQAVGSVNGTEETEFEVESNDTTEVGPIDGEPNTTENKVVGKGDFLTDGETLKEESGAGGYNITDGMEVAPEDEQKTDEQQDTEEDKAPEEKHFGWFYDGEIQKWYYYDQQGNKLTGWQYISGAWYYLDGSNEEQLGIMLSDCKKEINGSTYFFDSSGTMQTGWVYRSEGWYYTDVSGAMQTGWQYLEGVWYYLDAGNVDNPGKMVSNGRTVVWGKTYFFDVSGAMQTGWVYRPEGWYYTDGSGAMQTGWQYLGGTWYYLDAGNADHPGLMVRNGLQVINGNEYQFNSSGAMQTGWIWISGKGWKYTNASGYQQTGWQYLGGTWYYLDGSNENLMVANAKKAINGKTYFFDPSGVMRTGWVYRSEGWYYTDVSGAMQTDWVKLGGKWYFLDAGNVEYPGLMVRDCEKEIWGKRYTFLSSGEMLAGWSYQAGDWYYYDTFSGQQVSGWKEINGTWYYMDPQNANKMVSNCWKKIYDKWYSFESSGAMRTGWFYAGVWYYLGGDGAMRTGWQAIGGDWYYFYTSNNSYGKIEGEMAKNVKIDGWQLGNSGAMISTAQMKMQARAQAYASSTPYLILVDRASCKVGIFTGSYGSWNLSKYWACSPGKPSTPTISGTFKVGIKGYYFDSGSSRCFWYTQFKGDYLFHSVLYNKYNTNKIDDGRLGMQLSHGCVRLDINNAKWIYDNIPRNTTVVVY